MSVGLQVWSQTAATNSTADTNISWPEGMAPSQVNDSARATMASAAKWRDDNSCSIITSGSTVAFTVTSSQVSTGNTNGYTIAVQFHATPDSSATLNVDGAGAAPLQLVSGTNLLGQEFQAGEDWRFTYSSTATAWIANGGGYIRTNNLMANAVTYSKIQQVGASSLLGNASTSTSTVQEITLGTNLSFSGTVLNAGNNTPVITVFTSTGSATWNSTTQNGSFPLYLRVRMIGGGGGGGAQSTNPGVAGTDTSFASWTAVHGSGGAVAGGGGGTGGTGGTNGTGTVITRVNGATGVDGSQSVSGNQFPGGNGGSSFFGGAGAGVKDAQGGAAQANTGSGGAGAGSNGVITGGSGGGAGEFVEFIVTSPSTSYSVSVGGGGAGGNAGGIAGGNGGSGRIEVIAYWQ